jgi:hypothetical protein
MGSIGKFYPIRAAYSYLLRLHRFGLLDRETTMGRVVYKTSERGRNRLSWLRISLYLLQPVKRSKPVNE